MMYRVTVVLIVALSASLAAQNMSPAARTTVANPDGAPIVIPRAKQYDITSRLNGKTYRIMVAPPFGADPQKAYPVVYLLDGNAYFAIAADALTRQSMRIVAPAIVVGIGYPLDDPWEVERRRFLDLTPWVSKQSLSGGQETGGGDMFLRVIEEEVKPFVSARYRIDAAKQTIYGQSIGGLMVLRVLFRNPTAFSTYVISSPSIWYNDRQILQDEDAFAKRARAGELKLRILITSAGDEQYRGSDPKLLAADNRQVDNASELADRLAALNPGSVAVTRTIFEGENHGTVPTVSLNRALRFALPRD
jgi:predicted alpha/beta superfamily hydrolase